MSQEENHEIQEARAGYSTSGGTAKIGLASLTARELRALIREVVAETLAELNIQSHPETEAQTTPLEYPAHPNRAAMKKEIAVYKALHPELVQKYLGQYVAIYQGKLVDHDADPVTLHQRVIQKYSGKVVLSRKVQKDAEPVLYMRSPRLEPRL